MPSSERGLVAAIVRAIQREYPAAWVLKTQGTGYQRGGIPDLLLCVAGRFIGLEVKHQRPGESQPHALSRATAQQRHEIAAINAAGGTALVVLSPDDALRAISRALT